VRKDGIAMKITKSQLRACARAALEQRRGYSVSVAKGRGFIPGARLTATKGTQEIKVAVRTSLDREIGLMRDQDGNWRTLPKVDMVLVAVPAVDDPGSVEVLGFDPTVLQREFDAALAAQLKRHPDLSHKAPIFVALDKPSGKAKTDLIAGLETKKEWREVMLLGSVSIQGEAKGGFIERVKREFAELMGVDVSKVSVDFRINNA
jgi:hypothetical protein